MVYFYLSISICNNIDNDNILKKKIIFNNSYWQQNQIEWWQAAWTDLLFPEEYMWTKVTVPSVSLSFD